MGEGKVPPHLLSPYRLVAAAPSAAATVVAAPAPAAAAVDAAAAAVPSRLGDCMGW